jgi:hypothetical protein
MSHGAPTDKPIRTSRAPKPTLRFTRSRSPLDAIALPACPATPCKICTSRRPWRVEVKRVNDAVAATRVTSLVGLRLLSASIITAFLMRDRSHPPRSIVNEWHGSSASAFVISTSTLLTCRLIFSPTMKSPTACRTLFACLLLLRPFACVAQGELSLPGLGSLKPTPTIPAPSVAAQAVGPKYVVAHFMVGNTYPYAVADWTKGR